MDRAAALAREWSAPLVVTHAIERAPEGWPLTRPIDPRVAAMQRIREDLREPAPVDLDLVVERGDAAKLILDTVTQRECDLVVTGMARDAGPGRSSPGTTVDALARLSPVPVLLVKTRPNRPYRHVVVATDFSEPSRDALRTTLEMFPSADITVFHAFQVVYESFMDDKAAARAVEAQHADAKVRDFIAATPVGDRQLRVRSEHGSPEQALRELVLEGGVDLVVVGTRGRGLIGQLLLGSIARSIVSDVPADMLIASNRAMAG